MSTLRKIVAGAALVLGVVYLLNPGAGVFELIPDNLPIVGNLDEALATAVVLWALRAFGIDLGRRFDRWSTKHPAGEQSRSSTQV